MTGQTTEAAMSLANCPQQTVKTQVAKGVRTEVTPNPIQITSVSDQALSFAHVNAKVTWVSDGRGRNTQVDRRCSATAEKLDDAGHRVTAHNAVVDDYHSLVLDRAPEWIELQADSRLSGVLIWLNKRSPDIAVLDQPFAQR
jgi:hypothetical protein